jgi:hypothetical protein
MLLAAPIQPRYDSSTRPGRHVTLRRIVVSIVLSVPCLPEEVTALSVQSLSGFYGACLVFLHDTALYVQAYKASGIGAASPIHNYLQSKLYVTTTLLI